MKLLIHHVFIVGDKIIFTLDDFFSFILMAVARRRLHFLLSQQLEIKKNVKTSFERLKTPQVQLINTIEQPESVTFWIREREKENSWAGNFSTTRRGDDELLMRAMRPYLPRHAVLNNINSLEKWRWQPAQKRSRSENFNKLEEMIFRLRGIFSARMTLNGHSSHLLHSFRTSSLLSLLLFSTSSHLLILILRPSPSTTLLAHHTQSGRLREL